MKGLITKLLNETNTANADKLIALSDEAINFVVIQALTEPENVDQIKALEGSKRSKPSEFYDDNYEAFFGICYGRCICREQMCYLIQ